MKRISKRVREEAALICAIAASSNEPYRYYFTVAQSIGAKNVSWGLASDAFMHVRLLLDDGPLSRRLDAEAEALLRTGWTP